MNPVVKIPYVRRRTLLQFQAGSFPRICKRPKVCRVPCVVCRGSYVVRRMSPFTLVYRPFTVGPSWLLLKGAAKIRGLDDKTGGFLNKSGYKGPCMPRRKGKGYVRVCSPHIQHHRQHKLYTIYFTHRTFRHN